MYNVVIIEKDGKVIRAGLAKGVFVSESGNEKQSTIIILNGREAAERLLEYEKEGAHVSHRDRLLAERLLA